MRVNFLRSRTKCPCKDSHTSSQAWVLWPHFACWAIRWEKNNNIKGKISSHTQRVNVEGFFDYLLQNVGKTFPSHLANLALSFIVHVFFHLFFSCNKMMTSPSQPSQPWICDCLMLKEKSDNKTVFCFSLKWWCSFFMVILIFIPWDSYRTVNKENTNEANPSHPKIFFYITNSRFWHSWRLPRCMEPVEGGCKSRPIVIAIYTRWFKLRQTWVTDVLHIHCLSPK